MTQLTLFADLPRQPAPTRGRPPLPAGSIALLERAAAKLSLAAEARGHLAARHLASRAADLLREAKARDLAAAVYHELDQAIGHPYLDTILVRVERRITDRDLRAVGVR